MTLVILVCTILFVVTLLLAIADHFLIRYGDCKIDLKEEDETREFKVKGGVTLLSALTENGVEVRAPCGGKATCGYCKTRVVEGGGPVLPTEEALISREEIADNMRLACQVKVKNDIRLEIPDYFQVVRNIVKNKSYDPDLRYFFMMGGEFEILEPLETALSQCDIGRIDAILDEFKDTRGALVPILQRVNEKFKYLPETVLAYISKKLEMPLSSIYRVATFYHAFSLKPKGEHVVAVCTGTACHVKGAEGVMSAFENELGIKKGETSKDLKFTLEPVACLGCCGLAPVAKVGEKIYGHLGKAKVKEVSEIYKRGN